MQNALSLPATQERAPGRLPFPALIFTLQVWLSALASAVLAVVCMIGPDRGGLGGMWPPSARYITFVVSVAACLFAGWVLAAIHTRSLPAPARCRLWAVVNAVLAFLAILPILLSEDLRYLLLSPFFSAWALFRDLLVSIVIFEAWRRYFSESAAVRAAFHQPEPLSPSLNRPAEVGLFQVCCWIALVICGGEALEFLLSHLSMHVGGRGVLEFLGDYFAMHVSGEWEPAADVIIAAELEVVGSIVLPLVALWASRAGSRGLKTLYACLLLWIALCVLTHAYAFDFYRLASIEFIPQYGTGFPEFFSGKLALALVFCWYFATSDRARAWLYPAAVPSGQA